MLATQNGGMPSIESKKLGSLKVEVLSVYDLPYANPPSCVTLTTMATTLKTGPPLARHKNSNSFRFSSPNGSSTSTPTSESPSSARNSNQSVVELAAPLRDLYNAQATIRVVYANKEPLETSYNLGQLRIS